MEPIAEKQDALRKAEHLLRDGEEQSLRYAALELRRCVEAVVYEKLLVYKDRLPPKLTRTWQPPQAFKALVQLEPGAQHSSMTRIAGEPGGPFHVLGHDLRPDPAWVTKTWNKLGSYLHALSPFARQTAADAEATRDFLLEVARQLHPFVDHSFTGSLAVVVSVDCFQCGSLIIANEAGVRERGYVTCLNPACEARNDATFDGDAIYFHPAGSSATCPDCTSTITIPENKIKLGSEFVCPSCRACFKFVSQNWSFEKVNSEEAPTAHESDI